MGPTLTLMATLYAFSSVCSSTVAPGTVGATRSTSSTVSQTESMGASTSKRFSNRTGCSSLCPVAPDRLDDGVERRDAVPAHELVDVRKRGGHAAGHGREATGGDAGVDPHHAMREA